MLDGCGLVRVARLASSSRFPDLGQADALVLLGAIRCRADCLLTGDDDFASYFGRVIDGVLILRPGDYLRLRGVSQ
jgi:hypothetical protein